MHLQSVRNEKSKCNPTPGTNGTSNKREGEKFEKILDVVVFVKIVVLVVIFLKGRSSSE